MNIINYISTVTSNLFIPSNNETYLNLKGYGNLLLKNNYKHLCRLESDFELNATLGKKFSFEENLLEMENQFLENLYEFKDGPLYLKDFSIFLVDLRNVKITQNGREFIKVGKSVKFRILKTYFGLNFYFNMDEVSGSCSVSFLMIIKDLFITVNMNPNVYSVPLNKNIFIMLDKIDYFYPLKEEEVFNDYKITYNAPSDSDFHIKINDFYLTSEKGISCFVLNDLLKIPAELKMKESTIEFSNLQAELNSEGCMFLKELFFDFKNEIEIYRREIIVPEGIPLTFFMKNSEFCYGKFLNSFHTLFKFKLKSFSFTNQIGKILLSMYLQNSSFYFEPVLEESKVFFELKDNDFSFKIEEDVKCLVSHSLINEIRNFQDLKNFEFEFLNHTSLNITKKELSVSEIELQIEDQTLYLNLSEEKNLSYKINDKVILIEISVEENKRKVTLFNDVIFKNLSDKKLKLVIGNEMVDINDNNSDILNLEPFSDGCYPSSDSYFLRIITEGYKQSVDSLKFYRTFKNFNEPLGIVSQTSFLCFNNSADDMHFVLGCDHLIAMNNGNIITYIVFYPYFFLFNATPISLDLKFTNPNLNVTTYFNIKQGCSVSLPFLRKEDDGILSSHYIDEESTMTRKDKILKVNEDLDLGINYNIKKLSLNNQEYKTKIEEVIIYPFFMTYNFIKSKILLKSKNENTILIEKEENIFSFTESKINKSTNNLKCKLEINGFKSDQLLNFKLPEIFVIMKLENKNHEFMDIAVEMNYGKGKYMHSKIIKFKYANILENESEYEFEIEVGKMKFTIKKGESREIHFGKNNGFFLILRDDKFYIPCAKMNNASFYFKNEIFRLNVNFLGKQRILQIKRGFWPYKIINNTQFAILFSQYKAKSEFQILPSQEKDFAFEDLKLKKKMDIRILKLEKIKIKLNLEKKMENQQIEGFFFNFSKKEGVKIIEIGTEIAEESKESSLNSLNFYIKTLSISLVHIEEIICIHLRNLKLNIFRKEDSLKFIEDIHLSVSSVQIDNQKVMCHFPVMMHPKKPALYFKSEKIDAANLNKFIFFNLEVFRFKNEDGTTRTEFNYMVFLIQEFVLQIEESTLKQIITFFKHEPSEKSNIIILKCTDCKNIECMCINLHESQGNNVKINTLHIHPLKINFSFIKSKKGSFLSSIVNFLVQNVSDLKCKFNTFVLMEIDNSIENLLEILINNYRVQMINQLFKIFGSLDFLGNLSSLTSSFSIGVHDLFYEPYLGLMSDDPLEITKGIARGGKSFLKNALSGVSNTVSKVSSSISKGVSLATFDPEFEKPKTYKNNYYDDRLLLIPVANLDDMPSMKAFSHGTGRLFESVYSGISGVIEKPIKGAKKGFRGFISGLGKGVIGAVTKPVVGLADFASGVTETIKTTVDGSIICRLQYPRPPSVMVKEYNIALSWAYYIFESYVQKENEEIFISGCMGYVKAERDDPLHVILTNKRIILCNYDEIIYCYLKGITVESDLSGFNVGDVKVVTDKEFGSEVLSVFNSLISK